MKSLDPELVQQLKLCDRVRVRVCVLWVGSVQKDIFAFGYRLTTVTHLNPNHICYSDERKPRPIGLGRLWVDRRRTSAG